MKKVLVTGANKEIGKAIALKLAAEDRHITIHYNTDKASAESVRDSILEKGYQADIISFDISNNQQT